MGWLDKLVGDTQLRLLRLLRHSAQSITSLAATLKLTDNAVRTHIAALSRNGLVHESGTQRDTGGKPARVYDLTPAGEELFPKAYSAVLSGVIEQIAEREGWERALEVVRAVGKGAAGTPSTDPDLQARAAAAATALRSLGGEMTVTPAGAGWLLQGDGCPLSSVTMKHPQVCALAHALVSEVTQHPVVERCDHSGRPRCAFEVLPTTH